MFLRLMHACLNVAMDRCLDWLDSEEERFPPGPKSKQVRPMRLVYEQKLSVGSAVRSIRQLHILFLAIIAIYFFYYIES